MAEDLETNEQPETGREKQPGEPASPASQDKERLAAEIVADFLSAEAAGQQLEGGPDMLSAEAKEQEIKEKQLKARAVIQKFENFCNLFRQAHISNQNELPASVNFSFMNLDSNEITEAVANCRNVIFENFLRNAQALQLGLMRWNSLCPEREAVEGFLNRVVGASMPRLESAMVEIDDIDGRASNHSYAVFTFLRVYGNFGERQYQEVQKIFSRHPEYFEQIAQDFINDEEVLMDRSRSEYLALVLNYASDETKNLILDRLNKLWQETDIPGDWESVSGVVGGMLESWHKDTSAVGERLLARMVESQGKEAFQQRFFDRLDEIEKFAGSGEFNDSSTKRQQVVESIQRMSVIFQRMLKDLDPEKQMEIFEKVTTIYSRLLYIKHSGRFEEDFNQLLENTLQNIKNTEGVNLKPYWEYDLVKVIEHWSAYGSTKKYAEAAFQKFGEKICRNIPDSMLTHNDAYKVFLRYGDAAMKQEVVDRLFNSSGKERINHRLAVSVKEGRLSEAAEDAFSILQIYGFSKKDCEELIQAWKVAGPIEKDGGSRGFFSRHNQVAQSINTIYDLERQHSGAAKTLFKEFGIRTFARYPVEMLLAQVREKDNRDLPYGVLAYPREDHNGAFLSDVGTFLDLYRQLEGKYLVRIVECNGKMDLTKRFLKFDKSYGENQKISFAIVGGHGSQFSIQIGSEKSKTGVMWQGDLRRGSISKKITSLFKPNSDIVLISCSTGADGGIGQMMSSSIEGARVIAPDIPSNVGRFKAQMTGDKIKFDVEFVSGARTRVYAGGRSER